MAHRPNQDDLQHEVRKQLVYPQFNTLQQPKDSSIQLHHDCFQVPYIPSGTAFGTRKRP